MPKVLSLMLSWDAMNPIMLIKYTLRQHIFHRCSSDESCVGFLMRRQNPTHCVTLRGGSTGTQSFASDVQNGVFKGIYFA